MAAVTTPTEQPDVTELLDTPCFSARQVLELIALVRTLKPRDGLRTLEDTLIDLTHH